MRMTAKHMGLLTGMIVLTIGACLPIWIVWHLDDRCGVSGGGFIWQAVMQLPDNGHYCEPSELLSLHSQNLLTAAGLYLMAWILGGIVYWIARRKGKR